MIILRFRFSSLPFLLKYSILRSLPIESSLKLLSASKETRLFTLFHGPFPQKIRELKLEFTLFTKGPLKGWTRSVQVGIRAEGYRFLWLANRNHHLIDDEPSRKGQKVSYALHKGFNRLVRSLKSCEKLDLDLDPPDFNDKTPKSTKSLYEIERFMPNIEHVREMRLNARLDNWQLVFPFLSPIVSDSLAIDRLSGLFGLPDDALAEIETFFKKAFEKQLLTCQRCTFLEQPPIAILSALQETNMKLIEIQANQGVDEFLAYFARYGIPSRNRQARLVLRSRALRGRSEKVTLAKNTFKNLPGIREIPWQEKPRRVYSPYAGEQYRATNDYFEKNFVNRDDQNDQWKTIYSISNGSHFEFSARNRPIITRIE